MIIDLPPLLLALALKRGWESSRAIVAALTTTPVYCAMAVAYPTPTTPQPHRSANSQSSTMSVALIATLIARQDFKTHTHETNLCQCARTWIQYSSINLWPGYSSINLWQWGRWGIMRSDVLSGLSLAGFRDTVRGRILHLRLSPVFPAASPLTPD